LKYDSPHLDYLVKSDKTGKVYLVFEEFKSIMVSTSKTNEGYLFKNVPKGMAVKTVFISYQNEKPELSIQHSIVSEKGITINNFKEFTLTELDAELAKI
jgi:hypothetical protein